MSVKTSKDIRSTRLDKTFPFGREAILLIVKEIESGLNRKEACAKYGMAYATLSEWMSQYGSETYHATKKVNLSAHQKRSIVRAVNEGRMTKEEAYHSHRIRKRLLNDWILKYKREEQQLAVNNQQPMSPIDISAVSSDELQQARLKIKALETMIDIAEEQFKISIRKKSGAKQ